MSVALTDPIGKQGQAHGPRPDFVRRDDVPGSSVRKARAVLRYSPELADAVMADETKLDAAYDQATALAFWPRAARLNTALSTPALLTPAVNTKAPAYAGVFGAAAT